MPPDKLQNPLTEELQEKKLEMVSGGLELGAVSKRSARLGSGDAKDASVNVSMINPEQSTMVIPELGTIEDEKIKLSSRP